MKRIKLQLIMISKLGKKFEFLLNFNWHFIRQQSWIEQRSLLINESILCEWKSCYWEQRGWKNWWIFNQIELFSECWVPGIMKRTKTSHGIGGRSLSNGRDFSTNLLRLRLWVIANKGKSGLKPQLWDDMIGRGISFTTSKKVFNIRRAEDAYIKAIDSIESISNFPTKCFWMQVSKIKQVPGGQFDQSLLNNTSGV